ncbi:anthranilate phosphoribosyltransferase [Seleniivibrio woodruffii]|uniref:anthranilate phosphoribosyltransferase n=1 Tax=Seleniivibrio woodruffii TaxID=1078050 RepID=UPI002409B552|nr:anthranilate phosphoribosyltransferase [Seleniivibrio woodruffii]
MSVELVKKSCMGGSLTFEETYSAFIDMMDGKLEEAEIAGILISMRLRGETVDEIAGAARAMNEKKISFDTDTQVYDTCGTGGSGKSTMNVSSAVAVLLSAMGYPVVKHGNRAVSGVVGSADIFEMSGVPVSSEKNDMQGYFLKHNFAFLFAPMYHPALKYAGAVRRKLRVPTIFNFLGPLANPANVGGQIVGMAMRDKLAILAESLLMLGRDRVAVYSSLDGYDEISSFAPTEVHEVSAGRIIKHFINPAEYFTPFHMPIIKDNKEAEYYFNLAISPKGGEYSKLIALNAGLALTVFGKADNIRDGFGQALSVINSGAVLEKLSSLKGN